MTRIGYSVEVDRESIQSAIDYFTFLGGNTDEALRVAINKAGPKVKTASSKAIREQVRLSAKYVGGQLRFDRATRQKLQGAIRAPTRGILLPRFSTDAQIAGDKVSWIKPPPIPPLGIRVKVKPSGSAKVMSRDWFYMVLPDSRALGIARRRPRGQRGPRGGKYEVAYGPSVSQVFSRETRDRLIPEASQELTEQLLDAMRFLLQKKYPQE